jgi:UDP-glucose 4-epimerase
MTKHSILVTGGNGFIGSQVAKQLHNAGHTITIVDLASENPFVPGVTIVQDYQEFFARNTVKYDTVVHLAAEHLVSQSVTDPAKYYVNNVVKMKDMLDNIVAVGIKNIIFSSSGNVYGRQGIHSQLIEDSYYDPENPYASTKVAGEMLIRDYATAYGMNYVTFRYFNASGADPDAKSGYTQVPPTHVVPILCKSILNQSAFTVFGSDYRTKDGTCIRDYVHVTDIARAHTLAIDFIDNGGRNETFNLGAGVGYSVNDLITHATAVINQTPQIKMADRRPGDPDQLVADISKAGRLLKWEPEYTINDIIAHSWAWEKINQK